MNLATAACRPSFGNWPLGLSGLVSPIDRARLSPDLRNWIELCESGSLHSEMATLFGMGTGEQAKQQVKKFLFSLLFGSTPKPGTGRRAVYQRFARRWPSVESWLRRMKAEGPRLKQAVAKGRLSRQEAEQRARGRPARISQRLESWLVIGVTVARLRQRYPWLCLVTCHDSILAPMSHVSLVVSGLAETLAEIGLSPSLRTELEVTAA